MNRILFGTAFLLGATAIAWMGLAFIGTDAIALTVTVLIAVVYAIGFIELFHFRQATSTLSTALSALKPSAEGDQPKPDSYLDQWLATLHSTLQNAVRLRIEGERIGLPAPVMTPYLVGLLVMLGLLGTFLGMVDTLQGAVAALEGTTELQAIRAGLAAPIKGLGLAFGTSVAGVAASAMLGLLSTLSRRDRMLATRRLDGKTATVFKTFSLVHNRQETYKALQLQAHALPDVADRLHTLATQMERMSDNLGDKLIANQQMFHESTKTIYSDLAQSVDQSLNKSLAESGRLAGESIKPMIKELVDEIASVTQQTHQQLSDTVQQQLQSLSSRFSQTTDDVNSAWKSGLAAHQQSNENLIDGMAASFDRYNGQFEHVTSSMLDDFDKKSDSWLKRQQSSEQSRLEHWSESLGQAQQRANTQLVDASKIFAGELTQVTSVQQQAFNKVTEDFTALSLTLTTQWQQAGEQSLSQQQHITESTQKTVELLTDTAQSTSKELLQQISGLLKSSEDLINVRIDSEATWLNSHAERMDDLRLALSSGLDALREEEHRRGDSAIAQLANLESTVATQLATLGKELEEPMTRLIQTASETPRAAAEVIAHLRQEISNNIERDNSLLEERRSIMEELNTLSSSLQQATTGQQAAVEQLVHSSADMLKGVGRQFSDHVESESNKISSIATHLAGSATEIANNFSGSAIEMSSLGEAFTLAVNQFNASSGHLVENLTRIEEALDKSSARSDEQLGYYVAQAREIIDHSVLSQKNIFEQLGQMSRQDELLGVETTEELS